jgi:hypothetical protein
MVNVARLFLTWPLFLRRSRRDVAAGLLTGAWEAGAGSPDSGESSEAEPRETS